MSYSRRQIIVATVGFAVFAAAGANAENLNLQRRSSDMDMDIKRNGSRRRLRHWIGAGRCVIPGA